MSRFCDLLAIGRTFEHKKYSQPLHRELRLQMRPHDLRGLIDCSDRLSRYLDYDRFVEYDVLRHAFLPAWLCSVQVLESAHEAGVLLVFDDLLGGHDRQLQIAEFSQSAGMWRVLALADGGDEIGSTETKSLQKRLIPKH